MNQDPKQDQISVRYELRTQSIWFSKVVEGEIEKFGVGSTKKDSLKDLKEKFCDFGCPEFVTQVGGINTLERENLVINGYKSYLDDNYPQLITANYFKAFLVNPEKHNEVCLVAKDVISKELKYFYAKDVTFKESFQNVMNQLCINYHNEFAFIDEIEVLEGSKSKLNDWVIQNILKQPQINFTNLITGN